MDQTARPVIIAASVMLAVGLVTAGIRAGGGGTTPEVVGDGPTASGAPDVTEEPTQPAPEVTEEPTQPAPEVTDGPTEPAPEATEPDPSGSGEPQTPDLDDMPDTGGGLAVALGGIVAASSALGLRRRR